MERYPQLCEALTSPFFPAMSIDEGMEHAEVLVPQASELDGLEDL